MSIYIYFENRNCYVLKNKHFNTISDVLFSEYVYSYFKNNHRVCKEFNKLLSNPTKYLKSDDKLFSFIAKEIILRNSQYIFINFLHDQTFFRISIEDITQITYFEYNE